MTGSAPWARSTSAKLEGWFRLEYYSAHVREDIEDWPVEAPHSKAMVGGLSIASAVGG